MSAHNQVWKVISSYLIRWVGPKWTVHEEARMGNMGLTLSNVPATVVVNAGKLSGVDVQGSVTFRDGSLTGWPSLIPTNESPTLTYVVVLMRMRIS